MSTTILTSLSTYMSKTSSMTTSKLKFVILKRLNKWKIKKKFRGGSCPGGKCTKVGGGRCHKNRGGRCHKNGGGKCPGGKCNTTKDSPGHVMQMFNWVKLYHAVGWDLNIIYPMLLYHDYGPLQRSLRMLRCDVNIPSNRKDLYSMPQKGFPIPRQKLDWDISSQMRMLIKTYTQNLFQEEYKQDSEGSGLNFQFQSFLTEYFFQVFLILSLWGSFQITYVSVVHFLIQLDVIVGIFDPDLSDKELFF